MKQLDSCLIKIVLPVAMFVAMTAVLDCKYACGQSLGSRGGSGLSTGSGGLGGSGLSNSSFSSGLGSGGLGGGLGGGGLGGGGLGGGGLGGGGFGGQSGLGGQQGGFIGRDSNDVTSMFENMARQGEQFMNRVERSMNRNRNRNRDGGEQTKQQVRVRLKVGFDYPIATSTALETNMNNRLAKVLADRKVANVGIERAGPRAIVTGVAANDWERMVVGQLVATQPGVSSVENRMTVSETIVAPAPARK